MGITPIFCKQIILSFFYMLQIFLTSIYILNSTIHCCYFCSKHSIVLTYKKWEKNVFYIHHSGQSSFLCTDPDFILISFPSSEEFPSTYLIVLDLLVMNALNIYLSVNSLFNLAFWNISSPDVELCVDSSVFQDFTGTAVLFTGL